VRSDPILRYGIDTLCGDLKGMAGTVEASWPRTKDGRMIPRLNETTHSILALAFCEWCFIDVLFYLILVY
jgi:hypothetical protein